ncbi:HEAT repeat domain-containing protein [Seonamhaeicola marinus]|uniref:C-type cytochrome n=1 Tax=Seonamhaeicola marinus TaxID=1912246 RepID=A0A5D0J840_9FLAO|nr:HEAT repeat domain-containing protein [Seonamhaeicola marinus]TYA92373.1 c-type cytochrome [Seonamhaeicola marinus]
MSFKSELLFISFLLFLFSCNSKPEKPKEIPLTIYEDSLTIKERALETKNKVITKIADGLNLSLWASDSLAPDPVGMDIDDYGNIYLTRTNRQKNSEFDIRGYRNWMTPSISFTSVEDRRAFLHKTFATEKSDSNLWLKDLNNDSIHDWKDFTIEKEEVWKLEDLDNDGLADKSTRIVNDFNTEITDVAGAILVKNDNLYVGAAPDMWKMEDTNNDGVYDEKTSLAHGFAVHIGFSGHGMSGAIEGPDGKIYWGIGDIGANLTDNKGNTYEYPNEGVIVRCNPDGSNFEVFAHGLRNTHEFVFDNYGNIISSDNDGDHKGEDERLVYIVDGSDAGWRINWQFGKYTDPKNNTYKVWMDEKYFKPRWDNQAAHIIPPIASFHSGPTGMAFNPGTGLGKDWLNKFFLVQFSGTPSRSHIWSFDLKQKGAGFELNTDVSILNGVLATGLKFGPDGALYMADWISGWGTKNYGRVWKLDVDKENNDLAEERIETQRLMTLDYTEQSRAELEKLLAYPDMRIRKKAQFELVDRFFGFNSLKRVAKENSNQFARIHAIWGIGQIASKKVEKAKVLLELLSDKDPEIIAQALKVIGDVKYFEAAPQILNLLSHKNARVQFFAAQALGRLKYKDGIEPILNMLAENNDQDVYLRHAGVLALSRIGEVVPVSNLYNNPNKSLRLAAVLVLRQLQSPEISKFLHDSDAYIVTQVARAINDDLSIPNSLPDLAKLLNNKRYKDNEPLLRRCISAALRVGTEKELAMLIQFAKRQDVSNVLRGEALATIATWHNPSVHDRVDGRYRGWVTRDINLVKSNIEKEILSFLDENDPYIIVGISALIKSLNINTHNDALYNKYKNSKSPKVREYTLDALVNLEFSNIENAIKSGMKDKNQNVRSVAIAALKKLNISKNNLPKIVNPIFINGSVSDQQSVLGTLKSLPLENTKPILTNLLKSAKTNKLSNGILLDLFETVESTNNKELINVLNAIKDNTNIVNQYKETLYGGNARRGYNVFNYNSTAQCVRCHSIKGEGGDVGPPLDGIGKVLSREKILEALVDPSARLAPGYGTVILTLDNDQSLIGVLLNETSSEITIKSTEVEPLKIAKSRIKKRENIPSSMPPIGTYIEKRELRDLIEYLSNLKGVKTSH